MEGKCSRSYHYKCLDEAVCKKIGLYEGVLCEVHGGKIFLVRVELVHAAAGQHAQHLRIRSMLLSSYTHSELDMPADSFITGGTHHFPSFTQSRQQTGASISGQMEGIP